MAFGLVRKLLPPEDKIFYDFFKDGASTANEAAHLFKDILHNGLNGYKIEQARGLKFKSADTTKKTLQQLSVTFVTPIDREDIQSISILLNKITKKVVRAVKHSKSYRFESFNDDIKQQAEILIKAIDEINFEIQHLNKASKPKEFTESNLRMREIENQCEFLMFDAMENLFSGEHDTLTVVKYRGLYRDLESVMETCYTVSDLVLNIVLKQS